MDVLWEWDKWDDCDVFAEEMCCFTKALSSEPAPEKQYCIMKNRLSAGGSNR